jgi:tetratricopeptide (TPR) repeat protein
MSQPLTCPQGHQWATSGDVAVWHRHALVCLRRGDGETNLPATADRAAWTCCLAPGAAAEPRRVVRLAEAAARDQPRSYAYALTLGAALYRAGDFAAAAEQLKQAAERRGKEGTALDGLLLALAYHRLGQVGEARQCLDQAVSGLDPQSGRPKGAGRTQSSWEERVEYQLLRHEAEVALSGMTP